MVTNVTPFKSDLSFDADGLRNNIKFLLKNGANAIVPVGSTGEWGSLTMDEYESVLAVAVDEANGKVPVICGASSTSSKEAAMKAKRAEDIGADGLLVLPTFSPRYHLEGLIKHFTTVAESTNLGIVLYNAPEAVGFDLQAHELAQIIDKVSSIVGVKNSTTDMFEFARSLWTLGGKVPVLVGDERYCFYGLAAGAPGTFSSISNFAPQAFGLIYEALQRGDLPGAKEAYRQIIPYFAFRTRTRNPVAVVKQAMIFSGIGIPPHVRPPLVELSESERVELESLVQSIHGQFQTPVARR